MRGISPDIVHRTVDHKQEEWVRGDLHTNSIENAWSLVQAVCGRFRIIWSLRGTWTPI